MRACGSCTLCCKLIAVRALSKPRDVLCRHCKAGEGCTIYATRPDSCRTYNCRFVVDPNLDEAWRPNEAGFIVNSDPQRVVIHVDRGNPDAWRREPYLSTIKLWSKRAPAGWPVFVVAGEQTLAVYPTHEIDVSSAMPKPG